MININKEQLLPVAKVPGYLEARGLGKRVHRAVVYRWISKGIEDVRLETVRIGGLTVTSAEAIQRWVEARERAREDRHSTMTMPRPSATRRRQAAARRYLQKHRVAGPELDATRRCLERHRLLATELDRVVDGLSEGTEATRSQVAGLLFRAGLRSVEDVKGWALDRLLDLPGVGPKSEAVVRELVRELGS